MLIDTHVHLNSKQFENNVDEVIFRALENDVKMMIVVGYDHKTNRKAIELSERYPFLYATVGFHPTEAVNISEQDFTILRQQLKHEKVVGIGECGLDFYWDKDHIDQQIMIFQKQIELSKELDLPLVIHMRDATEATYQILKEYQPLRGIMHSYSGSAEMVSSFTDLGLLISLGGPVTFKNGHKPKQVASVVPLDKLVVETDAPYLSPHPYRGKTNEPARVKLVAEEIAKIKQVSYTEIAHATTENALQLFRIRR